MAAAPGPQDVHPTTYAIIGPPTGLPANAQGSSPTISPRPHPTQAIHPNGHPENGARGMNGRDLPAPLPQMPVNGWLGSPDSQQMQQMRSESDPFHGCPPLVIDDKDGDCPHPPHHHNSGAVSDREHGGQLAPMKLECMYAEHHEPMPPVRPGLTGNIPLHHPQPQAQMLINWM